MTVSEERPTYRHKKHGTLYALLGIGKMQAEHWYDFKNAKFSQFGPGPDANPLTYTMGVGAPDVDMREVAIYRSIDDGSLWVRPREEFEDDRFEELPARSVEAREPSEAEVEAAARAFAGIAFDEVFEGDAESEWNRVKEPMRAALKAASRSTGEAL